MEHYSKKALKRNWLSSPLSRSLFLLVMGYYDEGSFPSIWLQLTSTKINVLLEPLWNEINRFCWVEENYYFLRFS